MRVTFDPTAVIGSITIVPSLPFVFLCVSYFVIHGALISRGLEPFLQMGGGPVLWEMYRHRHRCEEAFSVVPST